MTDGLLQELRVRFRETMELRLQEMSVLLEDLERDASLRDAIQKIGRHFHAMAGLGATYGFPQVSHLGEEGEGSSLALNRSGEPLSPELLARWRQLVEAARHDLTDDREHPPMTAPVQAVKVAFDVLIIEDDTALASLVARALQEEGFSVRLAATRAEGLEAVHERLPDAMIVDALLPDGSGYDVLEALRASPAGHAAGAVVMTVAHEFADKVRALRGGADAFVGKPLDLPALVRRVNAFRVRKERPPCRILAVEDDPTQVALIRRVLGAAGYEVGVCSEPGRFEESLTTFAPDLLLMDVQLADDHVNGYDLVRYIRQSERFATLPVIFVTGESAREALIDSTLSGGDVLVTKPVDWGVLLTQVASRLERAIAVRALTDRDALTGLLTRGAFESRARQRGSSERRSAARPAVLVLIDLDRFKDVNDTYGHIAGDRVLAAMGTFLRRRLRQADLIGRYGGEEFVLLMDDITAEEALPLLTRLIAEFSELEHGPTGTVTFSAGLAPLDASFDASFRRADAALYEAKRGGRARVVSA